MRSFLDFLKTKGVEEDLFEPQRNPRRDIEDIIAIISNMEPKDIEDSKDLLLELQKLLDKVLTGGD